jgi:hypothetical protein
MFEFSEKTEASHEYGQQEMFVMRFLKPIHFAALTGTLLAVGALAMPISGHTDTKLPVGQMQNYCQVEASAEFNTRSTNIMTFPVEQRGRGHVVRGKVPTSGFNPTTFECLYNRHNEYRGIEVTGGSTSMNSGTSGDAVNVGQMQKYCEGKASVEFDVRPTDITTNPVEQSKQGHTVRGQAEVSGNNMTSFECLFSRQNKFKSVQVTAGG